MRPVSRIVVAILGLVVIAGAGLLAWSWLRPATPRIDPDDAAQVALGQAVYAAQCARCHGANLEGQPNWRERMANGRLPAPPHDASGHSWHHPDAVLFGITKHGLGPYASAGYESDMPAFDGVLSDAQIAAALAYIKSPLAGRDPRARRKLTIRRDNRDLGRWLLGWRGPCKHAPHGGSPGAGRRQR